jgi:defect in organelle trafficking protein DotA
MNPLIFSLFFLFPTVGLAAIKVEPTSDAITILHALFGTDGVNLHGTGSQWFGAACGVMNTVILTLAGFLWMYTIAVGTIKTASEGEFLGKNWSSIWIPVRILGGGALLMPNAATGYSTIQVLVLYIITQGVGAGDLLWNTTLNYLKENGTLSEPLQAVRGEAGGANNSHLIELSGQALKSAICTVVLTNSLQNAGIETPSPATVLDNLQQNISNEGGIIKFPGENYPEPYIGLCGELRWQSFSSNKSSNLNPQQRPQLSSLAVAHLVRNMLLLAQPLGDIIAPLARPRGSRPLFSPPVGKLPTQDNTLSILSGKNTTQKNLQQTEEEAIYFYKLSPKKREQFLRNFLVIGSLLNTSSDFLAIVKPELRAELARQQQEQEKKYKAFIQEASQGGWIRAGSSYFAITALNTWIQDLGKTLIVDKNKLQTSAPQITLVTDDHPFWRRIPASHRENIRQALDSLIKGSGIIDHYIADEQNPHITPDANSNRRLFPQGNLAGNYIGKDFGAVTILGVRISFNFLKPVFDAFAENGRLLQNSIELLMAQNKDPIVALMTVGNELIASTERTWAAITIAAGSAMMTLSALSTPSGAWMGVGIAAFVVLGLLGIVLSMLLLPLLIIWLGVNFTTGVILAYYVPFIPLFYYLPPVLLWLIFAALTVGAAPFAVFGLIYPEGHDTMGKAEPAKWLLLSAFLRPPLIVFGFIFSLMLHSVAMNLFHYGYSTILEVVTQFNKDWLNVVFNTAMMAIYVPAVLMITTQSFSATYKIYNEFFRFINGPQEHDHVSPSQIESSVTRQGEQFGQMPARAKEAGEEMGKLTTHTLKNLRKSNAAGETTAESSSTDRNPTG